jgi:hypothetical protein
MCFGSKTFCYKCNTPKPGDVGGGGGYGDDGGSGGKNADGRSTNSSSRMLPVAGGAHYPLELNAILTHLLMIRRLKREVMNGR